MKKFIAVIIVIIFTGCVAKRELAVMRIFNPPPPTKKFKLVSCMGYGVLINGSIESLMENCIYADNFEEEKIDGFEFLSIKSDHYEKYDRYYQNIDIIKNECGNLAGNIDLNSERILPKGTLFFHNPRKRKTYFLLGNSGKGPEICGDVVVTRYSGKSKAPHPNKRQNHKESN